MTGRLRTSRAGLDLIKSFEGFREAAARLPDGRWTIGYGHVRSAREGVTITEDDAEDLLRFDLGPIEEAIHALAFAPLNQNQFDALASLVFNISPGQFKESEILRGINAGEYIAAASAFDAWRKARINGRVIVVDALVRRRAIEKAMFLEHPDGRPAAPTPVVTPELDVQAAVLRETPSEVTAPLIGLRASAIAANGLSGRPSAANDLGEIPDVSSAVDRLVRKQAAASAQPSGTSHGPENAAPETLAEASDAVAVRIARILDRAEKAADAMAAAETAAGQSVRQTEPSSAIGIPFEQPVTVREGLPDFDARPTRPARAPRILIDDTELYDPGRDPAELFSDAEKIARSVNGERMHFIPAARSRLVHLGPWIAILLLSILGLGVGLVENFRSGSPSGAMAGAPTVLAVFGLLLMMSVYFLWSRSHDLET
ncbi:MAG: lysozyme [Alphaproteobacteria bacterium]|nr:lysozyme [Alphaproteobacteria bacterium]